MELFNTWIHFVGCGGGGGKGGCNGPPGGTPDSYASAWLFSISYTFTLSAQSRLFIDGELKSEN